MKIARIQIRNYRNFRHLDVHLAGNAVIVGENKVGKSNLLNALRLVLDPSLPDTERRLRPEDFWDGLDRPLKRTDRVRIDVDLTDFEDNEDQLALLAEHLIEPVPMISRLTYVFQPLPTLAREPMNEGDYEFFTYGGNRPENRISYDVRRRLPMLLLKALRDAEADLAMWNRSPLRPLLDEVAQQLGPESLDELAGKVTEANASIAAADHVKDLGERITDKLTEMVGPAQAATMMLGVSPTNPNRLLRSLRLLIDGGSRGIGDASLGSSNLLYLALKSLELEQLVRQHEREHTFLAIEEPEAHLHPHCQRLVYRDFLRPRLHKDEADKPAEGRRGETTAIVTTHSPHIVSVAPLHSIVLLRRDAKGTSTEAVSAAKLPLEAKEVEDLERYLDVTRGEMLFARGVLLVEGDAELFLIPALSRADNLQLDKYGITVCSIIGTNFTPYVKLLSPSGLNVPFAVITDGDPGSNGMLGHKRIMRLLELLADEEELACMEESDLLQAAKQKGLFVNDHTLEIALFKEGHRAPMCETIVELTDNAERRARALRWKSSPDGLNGETTTFLRDIEAIGKGRFAQRLCTKITAGSCPGYIKEAIQHVLERCG